MQDQILLAITIGPLVLLGAIQLVGVRRIVSRDTLKVFAWGALFAFVVMPLIGLVGVEAIEPSAEAFAAHGLRMLRIWGIIFGLVLTVRIAAAACRALWTRRPRQVVTREG